MMIRKMAGLGLLAVLGACTTVPTQRAPLQPAAPGPVEVTLIAFNDFHGNLQPPQRSIEAPGAEPGQRVRVPAGGAAWLASAVNALRATNPNHLVVHAGDLVGASPLVSNIFLDEPTVEAMNLIGLDFNAVGNHEFDRGRAELLRLDRGGCEQHTARRPCAVNPQFAGADFAFLAANVITESGDTLLPAYAIRSFGSGEARVDVGIIGMTLEGTSRVVTPAGIAGLTFRDEAETVNVLVPRLKAEGADVIVVVVHEGGDTEDGYNDQTCPGLTGEIVPILQRMSPEVDVVVSGHTHHAYVCDFSRVDPTRPFLLTSAGNQGMLLTEIVLSVDPRSGEVVSRRANNHIVQSEGYRAGREVIEPTDLYPRHAPDPAVAALVARYAEAARPVEQRVVGRLSAQALRAAAPSGEQVLGNLIADSQLAATRAPESGGAQVAFMNFYGVRTDLVPVDGQVTYGQLFAVQPFGNTLVVRSMTGRQIREVLEQQFGNVDRPNILLPSSGFTFAYDLSRPAGQRVVEARLNGQPLEDARTYRVTMNSFLASGGDGFTIFTQGSDQLGGPTDLDALEAYFTANPNLAPPAPDRVRNLTPRAG